MMELEEFEGMEYRQLQAVAGLLGMRQNLARREYLQTFEEILAGDVTVDEIKSDRTRAKINA